jgi:hypothetical protein
VLLPELELELELVLERLAQSPVPLAERLLLPIYLRIFDSLPIRPD